jgi:hypothetical protein
MQLFLLKRRQFIPPYLNLPSCLRSTCPAILHTFATGAVAVTMNKGKRRSAAYSKLLVYFILHFMKSGT